MTPTARFRLLGRFDARLDGVDVTALGSERLESLLAYVVLHRDAALPRERLAFALWPDSDEAQARTNLRHVLHALRRGLPGVERFLEITPRLLRWRPDAPLWLDVATVDERLAVPADDPGRPGALREAVELYRGDLLEGWTAEWLQDERARLHRDHLAALAELAGLAEAAGELDRAADAAERLLRRDPLREDAYRLLMRVHAARGDRAAALRAYHRCAGTLEHELGVEPGAPTRAAYTCLVRPAPGDGVDEARPEVGRVGGPALVGRAAERARLTTAWRAAAAGTSRMVVLRGEAGVGKTRLVEEFRAWCGRRGAATALARCYPAEGPLAYGPVADWLRSTALRPRLARLDDARLTELARLLPELLGERAGLAAPRPLPVDEQRHRLFDAVAAAAATVQPLLLVVDDIPHADRETCQLLHYLLRFRPDGRLLVVATARTEDLADRPALHELLAGLGGREQLDTVELERFDERDTGVLAERVTGGPLPADELRLLHRETEGNPLFVVEALRAGWRPGGPLSPRMQSVIRTRLAQLDEPARRVLGVAAAIGREFDTDLLAEVAGGGDADELVRGLDELWWRRIVLESGAGMAGSGYDFAHDKIRQVAYEDLPPARRRALHAKIAAALEHRHADAPEPVSAQVAAHHDRAGATGPAIGWYRRAAEAARLLHADERATRLLDRALELVATLPASKERDRIELAVHTGMVQALVPVSGYASSAMAATLRRATALADGLGLEPPPPLLFGLALEALTRADFPAAVGFGARMLAAGELAGDEVLAVQGHYVLGVSTFWQADLPGARRHFEQAIARYRPADRVAHLTGYGQDPKVVCLGRLALTLWLLGLPEEARPAHAEAMSWSAELGHAFTRAVALTFGAALAVEQGDHDELRALVEELALIGSATMHDRVTGAFVGYVQVLDGDRDAGIATIEDTLRLVATSPVAPGQHALTARLLLGAHLVAGDHDGARAAADRLLAMAGPARLWHPLARRVRAGSVAAG